MSTYVLIQGKKTDLNDIPKSWKVGIFGGTFDPVHRGHLETAKSALKNNLDNNGLDLVLFYPHSYNKNKKPAPLDFRLELINTLILSDSSIGLLVLDEEERIKLIENKFEKIIPTSIIANYIYLKLISGRKFAYVSGQDRFSNSELIELKSIATGYYVSLSRQDETIIESESVHYLPSHAYNRLRSTSLRNGKASFSKEYSIHKVRIKKHYPKAVFE